MSRSTKKYLLYLSILIVIGMASASAIAYFNEDRIKAITVAQLNSLLDTEVSVGKIEFSLLKRFPKASIHFQSVVIKEKTSDSSPKNLLDAASLFLEFNPMDLLSHNYTIDEIYLEDANINLRIFRDGSNNFQFIKSDTISEAFKISLKQVVLKTCNVSYRDDYNATYFRSNVKSLSLAGEFESEVFDLSISAKGKMSQFQLNSFKTKKINDYAIDLALAVNKAKGLYEIKQAEVSLASLSFDCHGTYQKINGGSDVNIGFTTKGFSFQDVFQSMPENVQSQLAKYRVEGRMQIAGSITGKLDVNSSPSLDLSFSLNDGNVVHSESGVSIKNVSLDGTLSNGKKNSLETSVFELKKAEFTGKHGQTTGSLSITDFSNPYLKFESSSIFDVSEMQKILESDSIESAGGVLEYYIKAEAHMDSLSDFTADDLKNMKSEGNITLSDAFFERKGSGNKIHSINAKARFGNNVIHIDSLSYSIGAISSTIQGKFSNFLPYLFFENEKMQAKAEIYYPSLNLNKYKQQNKSSGFFLPVSPLVDLNLTLIADTFAFRHFEANNITCNIQSKYPYFIVQNMHLNAMDGSFNGWMQFKLDDMNDVRFSSELALTHVNIRRLFRQFENFGQSEILYENIEGIADASIDAKGSLNKKFEINQETVEVNSHIEILDGRLMNYETILALSKYVDVEELQDLRFSKLTNDIQIRKRTIIIPEMEIKSSAIELWFSGKQTFDGNIDYHFTLWLNDFLFKKAKRSKKKNEEFGEVELDKEGRAKLFLHMTGNVDHYKIKLDKRALREKWNDDLKQEKQELKELFKDEFSKGRKKKNEAPMQFELEWEEIEKEEQEELKSTDQTKKEYDKVKAPKKTPGKNKLGGKKIEDEYEEYDPDKFD